MTPDRRVGECEVCVLVRDDHTPKDTGYCGFCRAWMCEACRTNAVDRGKAWAKRSTREAVEATMRFFGRPRGVTR